MNTFKPAINILMGIFLTGLFSCSNSGKTDRPDDDRPGHPPSLNQPRSDYGASIDRNEFVKEAGSDGIMEVQMAEIALKKSQNSDVQNLAEMIRQHHKEANTELQELASNNSVKIPQDMLEKHKEKVNELSNVPQKEFDLRYVEMMIENHEKAISKFEEAAEKERSVSSKSADTAPSEEQDQQEETSLPELDSWINETLPVLEKHLQQAKELRSQLNAGEAR